MNHKYIFFLEILWVNTTWLEQEICIGNHPTMATTQKKKRCQYFMIDAAV